MKRPVALFRIAKRDLQLASVRYRGLMPACVLRQLGWQVVLSAGDDPVPESVDMVVAVKPLTARESDWAINACASGLPVVADLCDNIFVDDYADLSGAIAERFCKLASKVVAITVPTESLQRIVLNATKLPASRVLVVPDIAETPLLLSRQRKLLGESWQLKDLLQRVARPLKRRPPSSPPRLFWYGNHGASYANFGLTDLLIFRDALAQAAIVHGAELWVVSNHRERFQTIAKDLPISTRYFEWTPTIIDDLLPTVDVCLVPNSLDEFSRTKSANRALKALNNGIPVVATPTAVYQGLEDAIWLGDPTAGVLAYLSDRSIRKRHLRQARLAIERDHSVHALRRSLEQLVEVARQPGAVA